MYYATLAVIKIQAELKTQEPLVISPTPTGGLMLLGRLLYLLLQFKAV